MRSESSVLSGTSTKDVDVAGGGVCQETTRSINDRRRKLLSPFLCVTLNLIQADTCAEELSHKSELIRACRGTCLITHTLRARGFSSAGRIAVNLTLSEWIKAGLHSSIALARLRGHAKDSHDVLLTLHCAPSEHHPTLEAKLTFELLSNLLDLRVFPLPALFPSRLTSVFTR
ncbi:hypothetical protein WMY93_016433 [Mugilogobius chulae]|uniref:Uncharacterized protein n=1 Tax=Mugilogobius chulae TaxID=88201 RepID=A0AAW0P3Z8_9GOBI